MARLSLWLEGELIKYAKAHGLSDDELDKLRQHLVKTFGRDNGPSTQQLLHTIHSGLT